MKRIIMTGGGTSGHVTPNIAMLSTLKAEGYDIHYIGSKKGMEKDLIQAEKIPYHGIPSGKLRRYFDWKNFTDLFRILGGFLKALALMISLRPKVVFSKGGFVAAPVVWAAWLTRRPVVIHESDMTPGLANKISMPFSKKICYAFPESEKYLPREKAVHTGIPIRQDLFKGEKKKGLEFCGFKEGKPVITIMGGSLGAKVINDAIRANLKLLLNDFQICHLCGKGNVDPSLDQEGYMQFEYVREELLHVFAMSDFFIARAGATTLFELKALAMPNLLIPLSKKASRGDQILNAASFEKQGFSLVIQEEDLTEESLFEGIRHLVSNQEDMRTKMQADNQGDTIDQIVAILESVQK